MSSKIQVVKPAPHMAYKLSKGISDFCSDDDNYYIIRSDSGKYLTSDNLNEGSNLVESELHYSCRYGDHYLANDGYFYIIKGTEYRRVRNMSTDADAVVYSLHSNCQGGDHYLSMGGKFYIIFKDRGVYRRTTNMGKDDKAVEYSLHLNCKDGDYYWGNGNCAYILKVGSWGPQYRRTSNMNNDSDGKVYTFAMDVFKFLQ